MKLKKICKVEYDEKDQAIIPEYELMRYDVYFIDNEDYLCIDEDEYTPEKINERMLERIKKRKGELLERYAQPFNGNNYYSNITITAGYIYTPYIPINFDITKSGITFK